LLSARAAFSAPQTISVTAAHIAPDVVARSLDAGRAAAEPAGLAATRASTRTPVAATVIHLLLRFITSPSSSTRSSLSASTTILWSRNEIRQSST